MSSYEKDSLGTRMKRYEATTQSHLLKRTPVIVRIDGKAFHTYTKRFKGMEYPGHEKYPYHPLLNEAMLYTCLKLVDQVQGCVLAYTQSDEISLLLRDWDTIETQAWFDYNVQKMASITASIATAYFNDCINCVDSVPSDAPHKPATFDSRVYNLPKEEVTNYFIWRQNDASRNSVQMIGHHHFSQKQMHGKSNSEVQDMLMLERNINWNNAPTWMKRGCCVLRNSDGSLVVDNDIPVFTADRSYIESRLEVLTDE